MTNKTAIIVIVILLALSVWYFATKPAVQVPATAQDKAIQSVTAGAVDTQGTVSGSVEKTNPFKVDVNPYQGYTNPFSK